MIMAIIRTWAPPCHLYIHLVHNNTGEVVTITTEVDLHLASDEADMVLVTVPCTGWGVTMVTMILVAVEALVPVVRWCLHICLHP